MKSAIAVVVAISASARAHTIFQQLWVNGVAQGHLTGIRYPTYDGPITDVTSNDIICNGGPNPLVTPYSQSIITVPAGASVGAEWHHTLTSTPSTDPEDPIADGHDGPVMIYLAKVDSALQTSVTGLKWFKIYEDGFTADGESAVDRLIDTKGIVTFKIPSCIPPGNYFLRAELIALHPASSYPGAQFYMECAQINITGGGSAVPATVSFPGAYSGTDPGIKVNIYNPPMKDNYVIPGPRPFTCGGTTTPITTTTTTKPTTSTTSTTTTKPTTSTTSTKTSTTPTSTATGTVAHYGQCGGSGWTGGTVCVSPYVCTKSNDFYSQCL